MEPYFEPGLYSRELRGVEGTLLELGYAAAVFADQVMVVVLGHLVPRPFTEVYPAYDAKLRKKVQRPVDRYDPNPRTPPPKLPHALVLLGRNRF